MQSPASKLWTNGAGAEERLNLLCDSERHREDHRGSYRPEEFGFPELSSPVPECLEWLLLLVYGLQSGEGRSARDSP